MFRPSGACNVPYNSQGFQVTAKIPPAPFGKEGEDSGSLNDIEPRPPNELEANRAFGYSAESTFDPTGFAGVSRRISHRFQKS